MKEITDVLAEREWEAFCRLAEAESHEWEDGWVEEARKFFDQVIAELRGSSLRSAERCEVILDLLAQARLPARLKAFLRARPGTS